LAAHSSSSSSSSSSKCPAAQQQQQHEAGVVSLPLSGGFFLLNPDGDLQATQDTFQGWLQQQLGLQVRAVVSLTAAVEANVATATLVNRGTQFGPLRCHVHLA
jgi:hypothetical protein